jgi:hypothetical protein
MVKRQIKSAGNGYVRMSGLRLACAALALLATNGVARASVVYGSGGTTDEELYEINPAPTGTETLLSATALPADTVDLAFSSTLGGADGTLYALAGGDLYTVNLATFTHTLVGALGVAGANLNSLTFANNQTTLYTSGSGGLYTVNTTTGKATKVTTTGVALGTSSGDLAFDSAGNDYMTATGGTGGNDQLYEISPTNVVTKVTASLGFANVYGLAYVGGTMYGYTDPGTGGGTIISINLSTGATTTVGTYANAFTGAAEAPTPSPEPSTLGLLGAGFVFLLGMRYRVNRSGLVIRR